MRLVVSVLVLAALGVGGYFLLRHLGVGDDRPGSRPDERQFRVEFSRGIDAFNRREFTPAEEALTAALRVAPTDAAVADAYNARGMSRLLAGRIDAALADFNESIAYGPDHPDAFNNRAIAYLQRRDLDPVLRDADRQIQIDPGHKNAYNTRGLYHLNRQDYPRAEADFRLAIEKDRNSVLAWNNLGLTLIYLGQVADAVDAFDQGLRLDSDYRNARGNRSRAHALNKDFDASLADAEEMLRRDPNDAWGVHRRGVARAGLNDLAAALADLDRAIALDEKSAFAYRDRSRLHARMGKQDLADADAKKASELDPGIDKEP